MRVLIVQDSDVYGQLLADRLGRAGFEADVCQTVAAGREALGKIEYLALLVDLALPDDNGMALVRELRSTGSKIPIIVMTTRNGLDDRLASLHGGADDYVVKPFYFDELLARLHALLRRSAQSPGTVLRAGNVELDVDGRILRIHGDLTVIGARELELLELLVRMVGRTVTRDQLTTGLFGRQGEQGSNAVDVYIHRLRKVLEDAEATVAIETVRGVGYLMTERGQEMTPIARKAEP
ncbi:MAG: response regulator transcription factor [Reyranella sp.]|jgi:DNA-binding response OmpR family regulator|nr:response regulator transcription factor [Reyranella sp.]